MSMAYRPKGRCNPQLDQLRSRQGRSCDLLLNLCRMGWTGQAASSHCPRRPPVHLLYLVYVHVLSCLNSAGSVLDGWRRCSELSSHES
jgi:hypothetical protein